MDNDKDFTNVELEHLYTEELREQLKLKTLQYGDFSFEDNVWYCNKVHITSQPNAAWSIKFHSIPVVYRESVKFYALILNNMVSTIVRKVDYISCFLNYLNNTFPDYSLRNVNKKILNSFEEYLRQDDTKSLKTCREYYYGIMDFFMKMAEFPEFPEKSPVKKINPFPHKTNKNSNKLIPLQIVKQFDRLMKDGANCIPLDLRVMYWLMRSFPNRITEVTSMSIQSLKALYSYYVIQIPSWKQNGGYIIPEIKTIPIINSNHGKYIIELIKALIERQDERGVEGYWRIEKDKDFLFCSPSFSLSIKENKLHYWCRAENYLEVLRIKDEKPNCTCEYIVERMAQKGIEITNTTVNNYLNKRVNPNTFKLYPYNSGRFNDYLNQIAKAYNVKDEKGEIFQVTSHQFRHNAITDRLYIGGYTIDQLRGLTKHKNDRMPLQYAHQQKEYHNKMWMEATGLKGPDEAAVEFQGVIHNLKDEKTLDRLRMNPRAYLTWEANGKKGVGLCSNIIDCNPNGSSIHFECYECNWFVPKAEYLEDYKQEYSYWHDLMIKTSDQPSRAAIFENAIRNLNCLERIIEICNNGVDKYKMTMQKKAALGELN